MKILAILTLLCALAEAANTTLYVNTASTVGTQDCTTNTAGNSGTAACATLSQAESILPADITTGISQGIWTIICEGSAADRVNVTFSGTVTSATYYIEVKTDTAATYGRHAGVWSTSKYRLESTAGGEAIITISDLYVRLVGLQVYAQGSGTCVTINTASGQSTDIRISNSLIKTESGTGITSPGYSTDISIWNSVIYATGTGAYGIRFVNTASSANKVYNSTIANFAEGVHKYGTTTLRNNIFSGNTFDVGNGPATDTYNATDKTSSAGLSSGGTGNRFSQTFTFAGAGDYHLSASDAGAKGFGVSDPGSGLFADDLDSASRSGSWDIGADQVTTGSRRRGVMVQ